MFWTIAALILFIGAVITLFPLLRGKSAWQPLALALAFAIPALGMWMYTNYGTPAGIGTQGTPQAAVNNDPHSMQGGEMDSMVTGLRQRLAQNPADLEGWMLLSRTLKSTGAYAEAADALEQAHALAPENPAVMVELAEAWIYETPDGLVPETSVAMLERALDLDPDLQKGLWLMGVAAMQAGDDAFAISYWESLLQQLQQGSDIYNMVATQINEAQSRMGMMPDAHQPPAESGMAATPEQPAAEAADGAWTGTRLVLDASDGAKQALANGAVLYIMIRTPGPAMGPPLGVRRVSNPTFPLEITVTDQDSMLKERLISTVPEIQLQARVSLTGTPAAQSGDWQSETKATELTSASFVVLQIDQQVE